MRRLQGPKRELTTAARRHDCMRSRQETYDDPDARGLRLAFDPLLRAAGGDVQTAAG